MSDLDPRVRAVCDLNVAEAREYGGRHEYDGIPQDLSPAGVTAGLAKLEAARKAGSAQPDPHNEAHLRAAEDYRRVMFADLELHRRNPLNRHHNPPNPQRDRHHPQNRTRRNPRRRQNLRSRHGRPQKSRILLSGAPSRTLSGR